eukprot:594057_1
MAKHTLLVLLLLKIIRLQSTQSQCPESSPSCPESYGEAFQRDGYLLLPKLFDQEEINILKQTIETDTFIPLKRTRMSDGDGLYSDLVIWKYLSNDTYGNFMRSQRVVDVVRQLLQCDVVHYHTKLMLKYAQFGGKFQWHQDYGYWYKSGLLYPNMLTIFIAVDECTSDNGCLQVIKGSHQMGRIDHTLVGGQTGADMERVELIQKHLPNATLQLELKQGDALFFHSNLLHASDANRSNKRRYALLAAYSCRNNKRYTHLERHFYKEHHHYYTDIEVQSNEKIKEMGVLPSGSAEIFMDPKHDHTVIATGVEE